MGQSPHLIGQEVPLSAALAALRRGRVAHAQLIVGPEGSGKGTFAEAIARAHFCTARDPDGLPCGRCRSCELVTRGAHPDLHWVGPAGRLGIDEVRELARAAVLRPHSAACSVFVVEACERLTGPAAAALLKTLEDPVAPVLFLLLAEHPEQLDATLRSRCLHVRLRPLAAEAIVRWLAAVRPDAPEPARLAAARACQGCPGRALRLLDSPPDEAGVERLCAGLLAETPAQVVQAASDLASAGVSPEMALAALRDAWAWGQGLVEVITRASGLAARRLEELAHAYPLDTLPIAAAAGLDARAAEEANVNSSLNWQVLLYRLRRARTPC